MSAVPWTSEQTTAIGFVGDDMLLSAAAGSGKTAVLTERCFRLLSDPARPCDPAAILVVTFTEAAAAEMKKRIHDRVAREPAAAGSDRLRRLRLELERAQISTLHAFCRRVLVEHFEAAGLDPGCDVMEAAEAATLRAETRREWFDELYTRGEAGFLALVDAYGDPAVEAAVGSLVATWAATPDPDAWRRRVRDACQSATQATPEHPWMAWQAERVRRGITDLGKQGRRLEKTTSGLASIIEKNLALLADLWRALADQPWDEFVEIVRSLTKPRFPGRHEADDATKKRVQAWHKQLGETLNGWAEGKKGFPLFTLAETRRDAADLLPHVDALLASALGEEERYAEAKRRRRKLDFNDLERLAHRILVDPQGAPTAVAEEYRRQFEHVLVDEYQDINPLQEAILAAISRSAQTGESRNRFMVGDVKQSIYGFRRADCGIFLGKLRAFTAGDGGRRADLSRNFRSRPEVLAAVNSICEIWMDESTGCPPYDESARLHAGADYLPPPRGIRTFAVQPCVLSLFETRAPDDAANTAEGEVKALQREAAGVAEKIARLLSEGWHVQENGRYRPLAAGDVVVLLRSAKGRARHYMEALLRRGIPAEGPEDAAGGVAFELADMKALLSILDNPRQDIPLAAVLRSPLVRLSDESLLRLRAAEPRGDLWDALQHAERLADVGERGKLDAFLTDLSRWRARAWDAPVADLLLLVLRETGYLEYATGTEGGRRRRANLLRLLEHARRFDGGGQRGLHRFLEYLDIAEADADAVVPENEGEAPAAVRILTIHESKGLEFPVVVVPDLGKRFNFMDSHGPVVVGSEPHLGLAFNDPVEGTQYPTLPLGMARELSRRKTREEELRLFYVAMTRAREHLVLAMGIDDLAEKLAEIAGAPVPSREELLTDWENSNRMGDWLVPLLGVPAEPGRGWSALSGALRVECEPTPTRVLVGPRPGKSAERGREYWQGLLERPGIAAMEPLLSPPSPLSRVSAKMGVTELKRRIVLESEPGESHRELFPLRLRERPAFLSEAALTPTTLGTAVHGVFQHWDRAAGPDDIAAELARQIQAGLLSTGEAAAIDPAMIGRFLSSEIGRVFLDPAWTLRREVPFSLAVPVSEIEPGVSDGDEFVLVQGVIDALLSCGGRWIILDFKTDAVEGAVLAERRESYRPQLAYYRRAVIEAGLSAAPEAWIAFLHAGAVDRLL